MGSSKRVDADKLLTFPAASRILGLGDPQNGRRLRDLVLAHEKKVSREIAIRLPTTSGRGGLRVTISALKREFPAMFRTREHAVEKRVERLIADMNDRIERIALNAAADCVESRIARTRRVLLSDLAALRDDLELVCGMINDFDQRMALLESRWFTNDHEIQGTSDEGRE